MKKYLLLFLFITLSLFAQKLNFVIVDEIDVGGNAGQDNLTKLVNTINQLKEIEFVVFNGLKCDLDEADQSLTQIFKKIKFPVYIQPSQSSFWLDKTAREKFMNNFGELNFRKNYDSLKVIGLNTAVAWSENPFFERETFSFLEDQKLDSLTTSILILNAEPALIKNFDLLQSHFNNSKIKFIAAPLKSNKDFVRDNISILNTSLNSRRNEQFQIVTVSNDSIIVRVSGITGKQGKEKIFTSRTNSFSKVSSSSLYDPNKLLQWSFDAGYSMIAEPILYNNQIFTADVSGQVVCLDTLGKKKWEYFSFGYIYSTPTARDGYLAIGTVQGDLETINIQNGRAIQSLGFGSPITSDLLSFDYTGSYSRLMLPKQTRSKAAVVAGTEKGTLYCYDLETLQELWKFEQPSDAIIGKPLFAKGAILVYSLDGFLYSINAQTGLLNWKSKLTDKNESKIFASNLTNNSDDVFISLTNGKIFSYDILLGKRNWQYDKYKLFTSLKVSSDGRLVYGIGTNNRFHILSAKLGTWVREILTKTGNDKINTDITELGKSIYFGNEEGYLIQVDENYGVKKIFRNDITPLYSITAVSKNKLLLGYHNGTISLIRTNK